MTNLFDGSRKKLYRIGDVSRMSGISRRTLRLYDELGLVKPDLVAGNKYRHYSLRTVLKIPVINYLKMMGFPLEEISEMLTCSNLGETRRHFVEHLELCDKEERRISEQRQAIYDWSELIAEANGVLSVSQTSVNVKFAPESTLICMPHRFTGDFAESIISPDFSMFVSQHNNAITGPVILRFKTLEDASAAVCGGEGCDVDLLQKAMRPIDEECRVLVGGRMFLSTYHCGRFEDMCESFERLSDYARDNGYRLSSEVYERFVTDYWTSYDSNLFVVEIMVAIETE
jgi:DNA-binding transcriptional MerR regulator